MNLLLPRRRALPVISAAGTLLLTLTLTAGARPQPASPEPTPLPLAGMRILMTNDDSMQMARPNASDGKGLYEVRRALCAAGADVVVMAPWANQSGAGTSATGSGALTVQRRTELPAAYAGDCSGAPSGGAVHGVCKGASPCGPGSQSATPADTVRLALGGALAAKAGWNTSPDLVVSGSNYGPNVASVVNESGTLGAALAAIDEGVPAVALNSSYDPNVTTSLEVADHTYRQTAEFGADFVGSLRERRLLDSGFVVSINYPYLAAGQRPQRTAWSSVGTQKVVRPAYTGSGDTFTIGGTICTPAMAGCRPETKRDADYALLQRGHVTVTPISADRSHQGRDALRLARFVKTGR
ncbi:5'/3'-nucleotidase SurE [Streptomyces sp. SYSU K21746]